MSGHNIYIAQQRFKGHDAFRCISCGSFDECECMDRYRPWEMKKVWAEWMKDKLVVDDRYSFLFSTLTFGCTKCAGNQYDESHVRANKNYHHDYLVPGPQSARKRFRKYWDLAYSHGVKVDKVYGAEERGSSNNRLHYHSVSRVLGTIDNELLEQLRSMWVHGFSQIQILGNDNFDRAVNYVSKYLAKGHYVDDVAPFFYFQYTPNPAVGVPATKGVESG